VDLVYGSISVYLLIGVAWAYVYSALESTSPGSFHYAQQTSSLDTSPVPLSLVVYYSYVTLATLGYGDITPVTTPAQSLAVLEAITGQFYLTILVARLVGIFIFDKSKQ
jgi:voltage-gated potassium channel Kch